MSQHRSKPTVTTEERFPAHTEQNTPMTHRYFWSFLQENETLGLTHPLKKSYRGPQEILSTKTYI